MNNLQILNSLLQRGTVENTLRRGSRDPEVKALQYLLKDLGFEKELNWARFGADGDYGGSTTNAVRAFAAKNHIDVDGSVVTEEIAGRITDLSDLLDELSLLDEMIEEDTVQSKIRQGSGANAEIRAVQTLLNELGYSEELKWDKYGADGDYGRSTTLAIQTFSEDEEIPSDGRSLNKELAERILDSFTTWLGDDWKTDDDQEAPIASGDLSIKFFQSGSRKKVTITGEGGSGTFGLFRKGVFTVGKQKLVDYINNHRDNLKTQGLTDSSLNVMVSVSDNEGNLDAINTWDNAFLSFGIFQWTVGQGLEKGELPALLNKLKQLDVGKFNQFFKRYGLDIASSSRTNGTFQLNGQVLNSPNKKEKLRTNKWAYYFWAAGQDPTVQSIEVSHALSRLDGFYNKWKINGYPISSYITSEYGVALILDNHVNRPGYVKNSIGTALQQIGLSNPNGWNTAKERKLIKAYLEVRKTFGRSPMTDAEKRGENTLKYVQRNIISDEAHSFSV